MEDEAEQAHQSAAELAVKQQGQQGNQGDNNEKETEKGSTVEALEHSQQGMFGAPLPSPARPKAPHIIKRRSGFKNNLLPGRGQGHLD
eukprot:CAMPEP_0206488112 /NCGR_PEP_ID=MMETSP0324_2-20121206/42152_1 /ASSEMBLY_ACC=CAM_ASM_000836 /TAXON_ID=2866 /ORGANISM="Crypthecodinium cohnii, Strain Seligo" /LENGTH=87 /DNA_ID=CAMNT_0053966941 /DNA_START=77 /DNA_END=337 /DNA_ORIENTATION=-